MKRKVKVFLMVIIMTMFVTMLNTVNAAVTQIISLEDGQMMKANYITLIQNPSLDQGWIRSSGADSTAHGQPKADGNYTQMNVTGGSNATMTMRYPKIGYFDNGKERFEIGCVMTISNYRTGNGSVEVDRNYKFGFAENHMGVIIENGITKGDGVTANLEVFFYRTGDANMTPLDLGANAYIGLGGLNSEKRILTGAGTAAIAGYQWEWVSFDNQPAGVTAVHSKNLKLKYYPATGNGSVEPEASDNGGDTVTYPGIGTGGPYSFNKGAMANPTGHNIFSNGGRRIIETQNILDSGLTSSKVDMGYVMFSVARETDSSKFVSFSQSWSPRPTGTFSMYKFDFGKDVGSIELGIYPAVVGSEMPVLAKTVDKTTTYEQENLKYTLRQKMGTLGVDTRNVYTAMKIRDYLPAEVDFVSAIIKDNNGNQIATFSNGAQSGGSGVCTVTYNGSNRLLECSFDRNYLANTGLYDGRSFYVEINTKVKDLANHPSYIVANKASTEFNNRSDSTIESEEVRTQIVYDILTRAQNATISNRILNIKGGTNGNVVTFVPQLGYYIDSVEWQTQSTRYTDYNADIPGTNKVKVPETKDGSESAYKFVTTMNGEIPTGAINSNFTPGNLNYDPFGRTTYTFNNLDNNHYVKVIAKPMKMVIRVNKEDLETGKTTQGDAKFVNAEYTIYSSYNAQTGAVSNPVEVLTLDANGFAQSSELPLGTYYVKETKAPEGYLIDEQVYTISQTPAQQAMTREKVSYFDVLSKEQVIKNTIEITKYLEQTDSTPKQKLAGVVFSATLKSNPTKVYYSQPTDANGYTKFADLPYGTYTITETTIPDVVYDGQFMIDPATTRIKSFDVYIEKDKSVAPTYSYDITDVAKKMQITIYKEDVVTGSNPQGDADLAGAEYTLYRDEACTDAIETITTIKDETTGKYFAKSGWYLVGTYYIKETKAPVGYLIDEEKYTISQVPGEQTVERTYHSTTSKDEVMKGKVSVIKYDDFINTTEDASSKGAILRLTLNSKPEKYYDLTIDSVGRGDFNDTILVAYAPYTIPYGVYTVTEIKSSDKGEHTRFFIQPEIVEIDHNEDSEYRIFSDDPIKAYIRIQKTDADTGKPVELEGAKFKIWNVAKKEWVSQMIYPSGEIIDEFTSTGDGIVVTPEKVPAGDYVLYETDAPEGYYFNDELRIPENAKDLGNAQKGGKAIRIDTMALGISDSTVSGEYELYYDVEMPNPPQKAYLKITKTGDALTNVTTVTTEYGEKYTPKYEVAGIAGVTYQVVADGDIKSPDGKQTYVKSGTIVDTVITDSQGIAVTKDLYVGNYILKEVSAPAGYIVKAEGQKITLKNGNKLVKSAENTISLTNDRQKLYLTFEKQFEDVEYSFDAENKYTATFGVYTTVDIKNNKGEIIIPKGGLVDLISIAGKTATVKSNIDLPAANYEVKELKVEFPYSVNKATRVFNLQYKNTQDLTITYTGEKYVNKPELSEVNFLKINSKVYNANKAAIDELVAKGDIAAFNELASKYGLEGTKYHVYYKDDKGEYVQLKTRANADSEWEPVEFVSGTTGTDKLMLPSYTYYLKEIEAPVDYLIDPNYNEVKVSGEVAIAIVHDKKQQGKITVVHKDIDTKEDLYPTKEYEDDINEPYVTVDREKEINAKYNYGIEDLKFYELVEEVYPENAEGVYQKEEQTIIYYYKKIASNVIVKYIDDDTEEEISDGFEYIGLIGEDYETFDKEIEGYELVIEKYPENATGKYERDTIVVIYRYNKKNVETGDINVVALVSMMIVSFVGIAYMASKKRVLNK